MSIPKFQVWNKVLGKMQQALDVALDPEFGGVFVWGKAHVDHDTGEHDAEKDFWQWGQIELREFTGLKDEEGKEIYEGDIVRITWAWENHIAHVLWGRTRPINSWDSGEAWMLHFVGLPDEREGPLLPYCEKRGDEIHVIGNIYEHPQLLEVQP